MDKASALKKLEQEIIHDNNLPLGTNLIFGEGNPNCDVLFIGEAPGAVEDQQIRPFVGRSGQLLRKHIRELGWKEEDVYITNIVKRRPPENRDPLPEEITAYKPYLTRQIEIINPKIIVPLGRFSMNYFLPDAKISRDQGKLFQTREYSILPMLHPAAALRGNENMAMFVETFKKLPKVLEQMDSTKITQTAEPEISQKQKKKEDIQKKLF